MIIPSLLDSCILHPYTQRHFEYLVYIYHFFTLFTPLRKPLLPT